MVVISFMSIDDRKVKERFRDLAKEGKSDAAHQASSAAERRGNRAKSGLAQREAARTGDELEVQHHGDATKVFPETNSRHGRPARTSRLATRTARLRACARCRRKTSSSYCKKIDNTPAGAGTGSDGARDLLPAIGAACRSSPR